MADNTKLAQPVNLDGDWIADDDIDGIKYQRNKLIFGNDGVNEGDVSSTNPYPVIDATRYPIVSTLLSAVTTNQTSAAVNVRKSTRNIEAIINGTGTVSATVTWYGCNTNRVINGILLYSMALTGTTTDQQGKELLGTWPYVYCVLSAITGTGATLTASISF